MSQASLECGLINGDKQLNNSIRSWEGWKKEKFFLNKKFYQSIAGAILIYSLTAR